MTVTEEDTYYYDEDNPEVEQYSDEELRQGDMKVAARAMRRLRAIYRKEQDIERIYAAELAELNAWRTKRLRPIQRDGAYYEAALKHIMVAIRTLTKDQQKSLVLPTGTVTSREGSVTTNVDLDVFIPWAMKNKPEWLKHVDEYQPQKSVIAKETGKTNVSSDGEIIPGLSFLKGETTVTVEVQNP